MVNIAILGESLEGIAFIKFVTRYICQYDVGFNFFKYQVTYKQVSTEERSLENERKTINPTRLIFREKSSNKAHTIFAPGGDRSRAVVKKSIIALARISKFVIVFFSLNKPLKEQFEFFEDVRFFPNEVYVWLLEREKLDVNRKEIMEEYFELDIGDYDEIPLNISAVIDKLIDGCKKYIRNNY